MVLLAAAVCNKSGKALVSRQFVDMTRARIEGLLAAFPKLMNTGKQHTFVETESVRYVYQPLEKLFVVLITTKASNILEDLETLRLFGRVVPEYSRSLDEADVIANSFQIIFAFDEIVSLGYRENVNLAQIQTFIQMDSHEEKVAIAVRETQEREAKEEMKKRQKDLDRQRRDALKRGINPYSSGISSSPISTPVQAEKVQITKPSAVPKRSTGKGMQLVKNKKGDVDKFAAALAREGVAVENIESGSRKPAAAVTAVADSNRESVHLTVEEKLTCVAGKDGGLQNFELTGSLMLSIIDPDYTNVVIKVTNPNPKNCQMQTHPHMDKNLFQQANTLQFKNTSKRFPTNQDIGILKWRFVTSDDSYMPLSINCWPNTSGSGCDVNIEYELQDQDMELYDVVISIPVPSGVGAPKVTECSGDYKYDSRKNLLAWSLAVIDQSNASGTMEFSIAGHEDDFFPIGVKLYSKQPFSQLSVDSVSQLEGGANVRYSTDTILFADRYEIV